MDSIFKEILKSRVYDISARTPLEPAPQLGAALGNQVFLKREDLQPVFSFKIRGAYNKISHLSSSLQQKGVIAASAGNHAQGVALSAQSLGISATIVMPKTTPTIKVDAVRRLGASIILYGDNYSQAEAHCKKLAAKRGLSLVHPFDDPLVVAGQGSIGKEIYEDCPDVDYVFVPVGGGGLIAGVAAFLKEMDPCIKVIGVEPADSDAMSQSLSCGKVVELSSVGLFADGVAVKRVSDYTFSLAQKYVDHMITVSTDEISCAMSDIYRETRVILEPSGALSYAGLSKFVSCRKLTGKKMVAINSGANMNFQRLQFVAERAATGAGREALVAVCLPEKPGALKKLCQDVLNGKSITEFNYRKGARDKAYIFLGVGLLGPLCKGSLLEQLDEMGYPYQDLTENELAKVHLRHLVGGKSVGALRERVIRFAFPERSGALFEFLEKMVTRWNISLFHYRCHGGDIGRVLIGFEVPFGEEDGFSAFLAAARYPYVDETENEACDLFL